MCKAITSDKIYEYNIKYFSSVCLTNFLFIYQFCAKICINRVLYAL